MSRGARLAVLLVAIVMSPFASKAGVVATGGTTTAGSILDVSSIPLVSNDQFNQFALGTRTDLIGSDVSSGTFGVGDFQGGIAFHPGTNALGKAINVDLGLAKWQTPALSAVYPASVLTGAEQQAATSEANALTFGVGFSWGRRDPVYYANRNRREADNPSEKSREDDYTKELKTLDAEYALAPNQSDVKYWQSRYWTDYWRDQLKELRLTAGALLKAKTADVQSPVDSGIVYLSVAKGSGPVDLVGNVQFIAAAAADDVEDKGYKATLTCLFDLDDSPPPGLLSISITGGYYTYKARQLAGDTEQPTAFEISPQVSIRLSSFADTAAGGEFGLRYSKLVPSAAGVPEENKFIFFVSQSFLDKVAQSNPTK